MGELGLTYQDLGNLVGILAVFWGISAFAMGFLSDRVGRRKVLIPAVIVFSLMSAFSGMVGGLVSLLVIRAVMGLAEGPVASTGVAVAVEASHPKRRGMNNGIFQCMISLFGNALRPDHRHPTAARHQLAHGVHAGRHSRSDHGRGDVLPRPRALA